MRFNAFLILFFMSLAAFAQEGFQGFKGEHFIEVTGTAEMEIEPNEITLHIQLREFADNREEVQLEKIEKDFLNALKAADIDKKRLEVADIGSNLGKVGKRDKESFREKTYQLKLTSAKELEKLLQKLQPVQIDQLRIIRLHHTEMESLKLALKIEALKAARNKADALLKSIDAQIGKTLMVREWDMEPIQPYLETANVYMRGKEASDMAEQPQEFTSSFRKIKLKAQLAAQFEIK